MRWVRWLLVLSAVLGLFGCADPTGPTGSHRVQCTDRPIGSAEPSDCVEE